jgi:hypothetical protein
MSTQKKVTRSRPAKEKAFGNLDKSKEYAITQDAIEKGLYVLLHFKNHTYPDPNNTNKLLDSGDIDSASKRIGVYTQNTYDEYVRENEREGKVNTFNKMLGKYVVLHDPTIETPESGNVDLGDLNSLTNPQLKEILAGLELSEDDTKSVKTANKEALISLVTKYLTN